MNDYRQALHPLEADGTPAIFTGHGLDDSGRVYEGFLIGEDAKFFYTDDGSEVAGND